MSSTREWLDVVQAEAVIVKAREVSERDSSDVQERACRDSDDKLSRDTSVCLISLLTVWVLQSCDTSRIVKDFGKLPLMDHDFRFMANACEMRPLWSTVNSLEFLAIEKDLELSQKTRP